jgi:hypothetical protein
LVQCARLKRFYLSDEPSRKSLDFLKGLTLEFLQIDHTSISDLWPLRQMPLRELHISNTKVADLTPLIRVPLHTLTLDGSRISDLRVLLSFPDLENVVLPQNAANVGELRALKNLKRIAYRWDGNVDGPVQNAEEFWKEYDAKHPQKQ